MSDTTDRSMQDLKPTVWIGKQGCTETMIEEIVSQLKKRKRIKVKWLQNAEVDPDDIAVRAKANLAEVRGRTMVLESKGKMAPAPPLRKPATRTARETGKMRRAEK
jgi:RNA-binding protein